MNLVREYKLNKRHRFVKDQLEKLGSVKINFYNDIHERNSQIISSVDINQDEKTSSDFPKMAHISVSLKDKEITFEYVNQVTKEFYPDSEISEWFVDKNKAGFEIIHLYKPIHKEDVEDALL